MKKLMLAALAAFTPFSAALAADRPVPQRPQVVKQIDCVLVEVLVENYGKPVTFRVTAVAPGAPIPQVTVPAKLQVGGRTICIPSQFFAERVQVVEVCLGNFSKKIQGHWMATARANLARGPVVNPGQPMIFVYKGDNRRRYPPQRYSRW